MGNHGQRSRVDIVAHVVWSTRHRFELLPREKDSWLHAAIHREAKKLGANVLAVGNASDHVHVVTTVPQTVSSHNRSSK